MQSKNIFALALLAIVALIVLPGNGVCGRYLPTRSNVDQARRAQMKEILRLVSYSSFKGDILNFSYFFIHFASKEIS